MNNIKNMKNGKKKIAFILAFVLMASVVAVPVQKTSAESVNIWQVNGKFTLSKKKLVTYCALYSAASEMKKKKRHSKLHLQQSLFMLKIIRRRKSKNQRLANT